MDFNTPENKHNLYECIEDEDFFNFENEDEDDNLDCHDDDSDYDDVECGNGLSDELVGDMMMELCDISLPRIIEHFKKLNEDPERLEDEIMAFLCYLCEALAIANENDGDYIRYRFIKKFSYNRKKTTFSHFINDRVEMYHDAHVEQKVIGIWDVNKEYDSDNFVYIAISILGDMIYYPESKSIASYDEYINTTIPFKEPIYQFWIQASFKLFVMFELREILNCLQEITN